MTVESLRRRFTVQDYHKMLDAGILHEDDRVELLDGEIHNMSPIDPVHAANVNRLNRLFLQRIGDRAIVSIQNPIRLNNYSEPQPDLAILQWRDDFYANHHPLPEDVLLLVEIANTSAGADRSEKLPRYAASGIPEVWIVNIKRRVVEQYTQPDRDEYLNRKIIRRGVIATGCLNPGIELPIESIFG